MVDVLIIGAGASGAAVAWSLAETRMKILCLEQGDWIKPTDFPTNGPDWEARRYSDFHISPNRRARDTDYPINDSTSPMKVANFNGVGGGTTRAAQLLHFSARHPPHRRGKSSRPGRACVAVRKTHDVLHRSSPRRDASVSGSRTLRRYNRSCSVGDES
ncbi:MAG TPA: NAD(P)-binding protein, partial [Methyloceanibacter sp.]